jgi:hypothetical protein
MLVQDAAYASLLRSTRQQLHAQLYQVEPTGPEAAGHRPGGVEADVADPVPVLIGMPRASIAA